MAPSNGEEPVTAGSRVWYDFLEKSSFNQFWAARSIDRGVNEYSHDATHSFIHSGMIDWLIGPRGGRHQLNRILNCQIESKPGRTWQCLEVIKDADLGWNDDLGEGGVWLFLERTDFLRGTAGIFAITQKDLQIGARESLITYLISTILTKLPILLVYNIYYYRFIINYNTFRNEITKSIFCPIICKTWSPSRET